MRVRNRRHDHNLTLMGDALGAGDQGFDCDGREWRPEPDALKQQYICHIAAIIRAMTFTGRHSLMAIGLIPFAIVLTSGPVRPADPTVHQAVQKAIPFLQHNMQSWFKERQCTSCHHHSLGMVTVTLAREHGFPVDNRKLASLVEYIPKRRSQDRFDHYEATGAINGVAGFSYNLLGYAATNIPMSDHTDSSIYYILSKQSTDGQWPCLSHRPPLEDSPETLTALSIKALSTYAPSYLRDEASSAIARGRNWLLSRDPQDNEKASFKLFGLAWSKAQPTAIKEASAKLLSRQRPDGGWAQIPTRNSDAYATGQALVALNAAGGISTRSNGYRRGVAFLLRTQHPDGSWRVETRRRFPGLSYFESGFPYHQDQFISSAGTNWATMALILASGQGSSSAIMKLTARPRRVAPEPYSKRRIDDQLFDAIIKSDLKRAKRCLSSGANVNALTPQGATPLMLAVKNAQLVKVLLGRGANPNLVSKGGATALLLAAGTPSGRESVRELLAAGSKVEVSRDALETPLAYAVMSGDIERVDMLLSAGADPNFSAPAAGNMAIVTRNIPMLRRLLDHGLKVNQTLDPDGDTLLIFAEMDQSTEMVEALLTGGANPNALRHDGISALMVAAMVDPGNSKMVKSLLAHGADLNYRSSDGKTALQLAEKYGNTLLVEALKGDAGAASSHR